ncbi:MAG: hypothetical protein PSN44_09445 [Gammaproteobacteria bacterium]|nr:hypothetical protein [Gammaproteobacteria bacterium]
MAEEHVQALDLAAQGDWEGAHSLIQDYHDELASLVHGYLHREEGDLNNANYWYSQVGQAVPENSLEEEFDRLYQLADSNDVSF